MNAFERIIGYDSIKDELLQICDMVKNREIYRSLGARLPRGVLMHGDPGLGKTLMAKCFIEECGLPAVVLRKSRGGSGFVSEITEAFQKAKEQAPCIVFLDDMDKFANEDRDHCNAEEYVAVQAGIDGNRDADVFVFATVNDTDCLPESLMRPGRFDRKIEVCRPTEEDSAAIIRHYLSDKKVAEDVNLEDVAMMIGYSSCAELETILNEAAINAAYARHSCISMADMTSAILRMQYDAPDSHTKPSDEDLKKVALHEAGHLVVCEVLSPGSVGLASVRSSGRDSLGGFVRRCREFKRRPYHILVSLAGKAAVELYYSETCASGCIEDIYAATKEIRDAVADSGFRGLGFVDLTTRRFRETSDSSNTCTEAVVRAELERYMFQVRDILLKNREFLEKAAEALLTKETLLYSDIRALRESVTLTAVAV